MKKQVVLVIGCAMMMVAAVTRGELGHATWNAARQSGATTQPAGITYEGGDGSTMEKAVVIKGAADEMAGVQAESDWITKNHAGWRKGIQGLLKKNGKYYDQIQYATPGGGSATIYFDITNFFGK